MELFIIRHAQSYNNTLADQRERVVDPPLTEVGHRQAQIVARHLATAPDTDPGPHPHFSTNGNPPLGIARLYCSAMLRAIETADAIGRSLELKPQLWIDIHEEGGMWLDHGEPQGVIGYPGLTRAEIAQRFPDCVLCDELTDAGWWTTGQEEAEPFRARAERVARRLREMAAETPRDRIAIVSHGGFGAALIKAIFHVPASDNLFFYHHNTGITRIRYRADGRVSMRYQNRVDHLPADLIT